jgi:hypothetical protein
MKTMSYPTLRTIVVLFALGALAAANCVGQDVPKGVNYKKASAETNAKAKIALERALSDTDTPTDFLSQGVICGPILWDDLKADHESLSKNSTPMDLFLSVPEVVHAEGRGFRTKEQGDRFWKLVLDKYPGLRIGIVRPARANEIQFYWITIPFDIEEPLFAIETPTDIFIANLRFENDTATLFWLDRTDDLRKLKK